MRFDRRFGRNRIALNSQRIGNTRTDLFGLDQDRGELFEVKPTPPDVPRVLEALRIVSTELQFASWRFETLRPICLWLLAPFNRRLSATLWSHP